MKIMFSVFLLAFPGVCHGNFAGELLLGCFPYVFERFIVEFLLGFLSEEFTEFLLVFFPG